MHELRGQTKGADLRRLSENVTRKDSDTSVLVRFAYTRDAAGNPIAIEREAARGAFHYQYDQFQRLAYEACSPAVGRGQFISDERQYEVLERILPSCWEGRGQV